MKISLLTTICCVIACSAFAQATVTVDVNKPGRAVSPTLWGIFFEDINLSADGGIYPELVRNRSFEDSDQPDHWNLSSAPGGQGAMSIDASEPLNALNRHSLRVKVDGAFTLENDGYWGMNIVKGDSDTFRFAARATDGFTNPVSVKIVSSSGNELAGGQISGLARNWRYHTLDLVASGSDPKAKLQISASGHGTLFLDMVSLTPKTTWRGHGLRVDLAEALDALHPSFMRFPGGNWIEGDDLAHMYHWKTTIGDIDARAPLWNTWGYNGSNSVPMQQVSLPSVGTAWHTVTLGFTGTNITVSYDTNQLISVTDGEATPYSSGGVCLDMWTATTKYFLGVDNVVVNSVVSNPQAIVPPPVIGLIYLTDGGSLVISWSAVSGNLYRLQFTEGFGSATWNDILPDVLATGPTVIVTNALGGSSQRFYRVLRGQ